MTSSSQDLMRDLHWTLEMDSNQSGAVGGTIWGPKSLKNELNVQFFKKCPLSGCDIKMDFSLTGQLHLL